MVDMTVVQKTHTDTFHKEGKPQKVTVLKDLAVLRVLHQNIFMES